MNQKVKDNNSSKFLGLWPMADDVFAFFKSSPATSISFAENRERGQNTGAQRDEMK